MLGFQRLFDTKDTDIKGTKTFRSRTKPNIQEISPNAGESEKFVDLFKNITCENQVPCPKCKGTGFDSLSGYFDQGAVCFVLCSVCSGAGCVNDDCNLNFAKIKNEIENYNLSLYLDSTKTIF